jgi:hypothetical protein
MKPFNQMDYHATSERLVGILRDHTQRDDSLFFRILVGYYFCLVAAQMRCNINTPDKGEIPVNMYTLNLAPSGYGKTQSMNLLEEQILGQFRHRFQQETFPILMEDNLPKLAVKRATRKGTDPDDELARLKKEADRLGDPLFSFDSATSPAVKQLRHHLLLANAGSLNLIMDEVGNNLIPNKEAFDTFIELYDKGLIKTKLIKSTTDNVRSEEIVGKTPANLLMFGVPQKLFDGAKVEEELMDMLATGYARRCFFAYVRKASRPSRTPEQMYQDRTSQSNVAAIEDLANHMENLADIINANKKLVINKETCILLNEYQLHCEGRAEQLPDHQEIQKRELSERYFKVLKLAGAYAFIDVSPEVTDAHVYNAIKLAEDSGEAFTMMLARDKPWVKLAKYIAAVGQDVTQADLAEDLPFYKGGTGYKNELLTLATAYGYKNNIIIKKAFSDGIEFLRGETLKETDITKMVISYSSDMTTDYRNETAPFDMLHKLTQASGLHWVAHHLLGGYRNEENAIPGFNLVVIDVDGGVNLSTAKLLLKNYKFLLYTTKRHTVDENRFRIIMPINYELKMEAKDYKEFMANIYEWLPFDVDKATNQRARKWLSHDGHFEYNEGEMLDALPFIPKTSKNEERKALVDSQQSMDNLERWVINNIGDGNRNNMLLRYSMILLDAGFDFEGIRSRVMSLNDKIADKLEEQEIMGTVMVTVMRALAKRP